MEHVPQKEFGRWAVAYQLVPEPRRRSLAELADILQRCRVHQSEWPIGVIEDRPRPIDESLEAWIPRKDGLFPGVDFWAARPTGFFYATRSYDEDFLDDLTPRGEKVLEWSWPIWRIGEAMLHATRAVSAYQEEVDHILFYASYKALKGRRLWNAKPGVAGPFRKYTCHSGGWSNKVKLPPTLTPDNLPEVVQQFLQPLYELFDLFVMPREVCGREIGEMLRGS